MKLPSAVSRLLRDIAIAYGARVAGEMMHRLSSPQTAEQAQRLAGRLGAAARSRTPEGRVRSTLEALHAQLAMVEVAGEDDRAVVESWRRRVQALSATVDLVSKGYHGHERRRQLQRLRRQTDELLAEFLGRERIIMDDGRTAPPGQA